MAQRLVCDYLNAFGRVLNVPLPSLYSPHAQEQENIMKGTWTNKKSEEESQRLKSLLDEIEELKEKKE